MINIFSFKYIYFLLPVRFPSILNISYGGSVEAEEVRPVLPSIGRKFTQFNPKSETPNIVPAIHPS